jgi:hypothetical protein
MTFLKKLRDAAMECSNIDYRALLQEAADQVEARVTDLCALPSEENMRALIGAWAKAERVFNGLPPEGTPAPISGSPEPARLAAWPVR